MKSYSYDEYRKTFVPRCLKHCFCRTVLARGLHDPLGNPFKRTCCHCGAEEGEPNAFSQVAERAMQKIRRQLSLSRRSSK